MAGDGQVRLHDDAARPVVFGPGRVRQRLREGGRLHPGGPQHGADVVPGDGAFVIADGQPVQVDVGDDRAHVHLDAELVQGLCSTLADSFGPKEASGALPPSNSSTRASSGLARRYSARSVLVASSRIWPASSTPVGPAPTRANVSQCRRSAGILGGLGHLERAEHPAADGQHVGDRLHAGRDPGELVVPEVRLPHPGGDDEVVVAELDRVAGGPDSAQPWRRSGSVPWPRPARP